jgi:large subunit ribosomal protein L30
MIAVIRISGLVEVPSEINETLSRMRLRKKYTSILIKDTPENQKLLQLVRNFVAYGNIDSETLKLLVEARGMPKEGRKIKVDEVVQEIEKDGKSNLIKPFFRLHPPRKGIDSKLHFPMRKGVLGDNKEKINDLIRRML